MKGYKCSKCKKKLLAGKRSSYSQNNLQREIDSIKNRHCHCPRFFFTYLPYFFPMTVVSFLICWSQPAVSCSIEDTFLPLLLSLWGAMILSRMVGVWYFDIHEKLTILSLVRTSITLNLEKHLLRLPSCPSPAFYAFHFIESSKLSFFN